MNPRKMLNRLTISIHALREEGDCAMRGCGADPGIFLSTPSARRATDTRAAKSRWVSYFYPRPPRGGRLTQSSPFRPIRNFYPRPPRGGRLTSQVPVFSGREFLSTPSARRATCQRLPWLPPVKISIHALREEGDSKNRDKISIFKQIIQHSARI